jgi:hypothetical protein
MQIRGSFVKEALELRMSLEITKDFLEHCFLLMIVKVSTYCALIHSSPLGRGLSSKRRTPAKYKITHSHIEFASQVFNSRGELRTSFEYLVFFDITVYHQWGFPLGALPRLASTRPSHPPRAPAVQPVPKTAAAPVTVLGQINFQPNQGHIQQQVQQPRP